MVPEYLKETIKALPTKPGVYIMKDAEGIIIYIGKSKRIKSRVMSYFNSNHEWNKIKRLLFHLKDIDYIVTDTHLEARILECVLVKKHLPMYNAQFTKDKNYNYLKIEMNDKLKPIAMSTEREGDYCYGPFRSKNILVEVIKSLDNLYPIIKYRNSYEFTYRVLPHVQSKDFFGDSKASLIEIFSQRESMEGFINKLQDKMMLAASEGQYEKARIFRDIVCNFRYIYSSLWYSEASYNIMLLGERIENGYKVFGSFNGNILYKKKYNEITKDDIVQFLEILEERAKKNIIRDEKRSLDFKSIIKSEFLDEEGKALLYIDNDYNIDTFISKLKSLP